MTQIEPFTQYALSVRQLEGIAVWHERRRVFEQGMVAGQRSREQRLDLARRMDVLREQHRAIIARTQDHLSRSDELLGRSARPRAVVAHRSAWFTDKVVTALRERGVEVVACSENGAEAVGLAVAEQPELLLVEDALPMLPGEAVVREVLACAPGIAVGGQVAHDDGVVRMLEAGARAAYTRRVPPVDVAVGLVDLLVPVVV